MEAQVRAVGGWSTVVFIKRVRCRSRFLAVASLLAVLALTGAACGKNDPQVNSGSREDALAFIKSSATKSLDSKTFRATVHEKATGNQQGPCGANQADETLTARIDLGANVVLLDADNDGTTDTIAAGSTTYLRASHVPPSWGVPSIWMSVTRKELRGVGSALLNQNVDHRFIPSSSVGGSNDPRQSLDELESAASAVTELGHDDIDGVPTTHYRIDLDRTKLHDLARQRLERSRADLKDSGLTDAEIDQLIDGPPNTPGTTPDVSDPLPRIEVWVADGGLVRRETEHLDVSAKETPSSPDKSMAYDGTVDFTDYGVPLTDGVPPADQVTPAGVLPARILDSAKSVDPACVAALPSEGPVASAAEQKKLEDCRHKAFEDQTAGKTVDEFLAEFAAAHNSQYGSFMDVGSAASCYDQGSPSACPTSSATTMDSTSTTIDPNLLILCSGGGLPPDSGGGPFQTEDDACTKAMNDSPEIRNSPSLPNVDNLPDACKAYFCKLGFYPGQGSTDPSTPQTLPFACPK